MVENGILVFGAGVIGSIYALRLAKAGLPVSVLARGERLAVLRESGLRIRNVFTDEEESAEVEVLEELREDATYDLAIVALRSGQIMPVLRRLGALPRLGAVLVVGNNLEEFGEEARAVGEARLVLGFGAFGGYREGASVLYLDGRTKKKPGLEQVSATTIGILSEAARPALERVRAILASARLGCAESPDIAAWLVCHAALVFPLAGAIFATGGDQARFCRTRDAIVLGIRACKEAMRALRDTGCAVEPPYLRKLVAMPEWLLSPLLARRLAGEAARVAMFGHANAPGGRAEIGGQARVLDARLRKAGRPMPSWDRLLPWFEAEGGPEPLPDGQRELRPRWF